MRKFSSQLSRLLFIKGVCRAIPPLYVLWSIIEWCRVDWHYAVGFGVLTINYVLLYILSWVQPALMQGPWRVRPIQTFVLLGNAIVLPIMFHRVHGHLPYISIAASIVCFASLYVGTAIFIHLNSKLPMGQVFSQSRPEGIPLPPISQR